NPLDHDTEIPMIDGNGDEHDIYFSGLTELQNGSANVGIGYNFSTPLLAKLDVFNRTDAYNGSTFTNQFAGRFLNRGDYPAGSGTTNFFGVRGSCSVTSNLNQNTNFGGDFLAVNNDRTNVGVAGRATVANFTDFAIIAQNIGVRGTAAQLDCNFGYAFGVHGTAFGGEYAMGVVGEAERASRLSIGVYGAAREGCGPTFAGYFAGPIVHTQQALVPSDQNLKDNIETLTPDNAMEIISALQPKTYDYKTEDFPSMSLAQGQQIGFLAQELEEVLPGAVKDCIHPPVLDSLQNIITPEIEYKAINYDALIPVMVAAIQELKQQNEQLASQLQQCCLLNVPAPLAPDQQDGDDETGSRKQGVELSNYAIILDQNSPNPFAEQTSIGYTIPLDVKDAKIMFYDNGGRVLKVVSITDRGTNSLVVYASNLSSGTYTYSLIADGKLIDTKKMTCQK
ncbi:MAG TPA: tail fiber domain-containing protein, partial [Chitinophagales bacterium]|nr:tail fiber domain-containing protein [Chitinophagales bacterium]